MTAIKVHTEEQNIINKCLDEKIEELESIINKLKMA